MPLYLLQVYVLYIGIDSHIVEVRFVYPLFWEGIADRDILQTDVRGTYQQVTYA